MMENEKNIFRKSQKLLSNETKKLKKEIASSTQAISEKSKKIIKKVDEKTGTSKVVNESIDSIKENASEIDEKFNISETLNNFTKRTSDTYKTSKESAEELYKKSGAEKALATTKNHIDESILEPIDSILEESGFNHKAKTTIYLIGNSYGGTRSLIKPYFAPETLREILESVREQLVNINACICQISQDEASEWSSRFGKALTAKTAGIVATTTLFSFVSMVGTAGTGTAIATLSGAASTSATLAWIGGLAGGGMAAGAVLTGGFAIVAGAVTYKFISSERRNFEDLTDIEQRLVSVCSALISQLNSLLKNEKICLSPLEIEFLLNTTLIEIDNTLKNHSSDIISNLDNKNSIAFKQHVLIDYPRVVLDGVRFHIDQSLNESKYYIPYIVGGVFYAFLSKNAVPDDIESLLVLDAIRRSTNDLNEFSSEMDISNYLSHYSSEQLQGIANNVKGIYHELLFVHEFNQNHENKYADLFEETNHPGADIKIFDKETNEIIEFFQLKATSDIDYVKHHFEKYPDIDLLATEEVASQHTDISSSGISNEDITNRTENTIDDVSDNTIGDQTVETASIASLFSIGQASIDILKGKKKPEEAGLDAITNIGVAASTCALTAYLFGN